MDKINIKLIVPDKNQPRKFFDAVKLGKLKKSIEKYGIINPLVVEKKGDQYLLVDGERRFRAASELGVKEVPVNIIAPSGDLDRLVRQFHIQEQQENWTPTEKASVLAELAVDSGLGITKACELLGIPHRTAGRYIAFANIIDKDQYQKFDLPFDQVANVISARNWAKRISSEELEEKFTRSDEKAMERAIIIRMAEGELASSHDFTKLKSSFSKEPKSIKKFMSDDKISVKRLYEQTKAQSAWYLRNIIASTRGLETHIYGFLKAPDVKVDPKTVANLKRLKHLIDEFNSKVS